jgi:molecular chaperone DnaK
LGCNRENSFAMAPLGIDPGTSHSAAATLRDGQPQLIRCAEGVAFGGKAFPSQVAVTADGHVLAGEVARRQGLVDPESTATRFKPMMGHDVHVRLRNRRFTPEQLTAALLVKIRNDAELQLGEPLGRVVVTVPAHYDAKARAAVVHAAHLAGLPHAELLEEPIAAALAYDLRRLGRDLRIAVVDLGGGTVDVTLLTLIDGTFAVQAVRSDAPLGGGEMSEALVQFLAERFEDETGLNVRSDPTARRRMLAAAESAKVELTASRTTRVRLPFLAAVRGEPRHLDVEVNRDTLEHLVGPVVARGEDAVRNTLRDAGLAVAEVDRLILVGGPARMPCVRECFERLFERQAETGVDPVDAVAFGAAIHAGGGGDGRRAAGMVERDASAAANRTG